MSDAGDWNRVKDLFHAVLDRTPDDRAAFLHEACAHDPAVLAEVESLLAAHDQASDFAERPGLEALGELSRLSADGILDSVERVLHRGDRLGAYEVLSELGAGGMGEVYRAHDTQLGRDVALKILPAAFTADPERLARFERESRLLAALNHPHIAAIYGVERAPLSRGFEHTIIRALVLELVEGPTLAERLHAGALPIPEALAIVRQIAEALEAAHEKGIVHRDLKPVNVKITPDGIAKVLDFGLAKASARDTAGPDLSRPATITAGGTHDGMLIGTAAYMSPEQARGKPVDKRADIWAFGCVLYETLAGRTAFPGETVSDTIASILEREPEWDALPDSMPPAIGTLLRRCLGKDPKKRLHDIADARLEIDDALSMPKTASAATSARANWRRQVGWVSALVMCVLLGGVVVWRLKTLSVAPTIQAPVARFVISLPPGEPLAASFDDQNTSLALSPDGRYVAYVAGDREQLYVRPIDGFESRLIGGTEGADTPFFSPDGQWLGFFANRKLKKVALAGGSPLALCDAFSGAFSGAFGAIWEPDGTILYALAAPPGGVGPGLLRVSANGGSPTVVTNVRANESGPRWPDLLPDGKTVLFSTVPLGGRWSTDATTYVLSIDAGKRTPLVKGVGARYLPTGHLVYTQSGALLAAPFDLERQMLTGDAVPMLDGFQQTDSGGPLVNISRSGTMVYVSAIPHPQDVPVWVDRTGGEQPLKAPSRLYFAPRLSPDGRRLAVVIQADRSDVWVYDLSREVLSRLTFEGGNGAPLWTPDGRRLTFNSNKAKNFGPADIYWTLSDGSGSEERLVSSGHLKVPFSWSPDGRVLAFADFDPVGFGPSASSSDIWWLSLDEPGKPHPFLQTKFADAAPAFSPDGRWLAYVSDESGRNEIYVSAFPGPGGKWQISTEGGNEPVWPRKSRELFYRQGNAIMAVDVNTAPTFSAGQPRRLFDRKDYVKSNSFFANYDVTPDGQRFIMIKTVHDAAQPTQISVVLNWFEELKRRVAARDVSGR